MALTIQQQTNPCTQQFALALRGLLSKAGDYPRESPNMTDHFRDTMNICLTEYLTNLKLFETNHYREFYHDTVQGKIPTPEGCSIAIHNLRGYDDGTFGPTGAEPEQVRIHLTFTLNIGNLNWAAFMLCMMMHLYDCSLCCNAVNSIYLENIDIFPLKTYTLQFIANPIYHS